MLVLTRDLEPGEERRQAIAVLGQIMTGGGGLFDHGRILLGDLVHLVDRRIDLVQRRGLFLGRGRDHWLRVAA